MGFLLTVLGTLISFIKNIFLAIFGFSISIVGFFLVLQGIYQRSIEKIRKNLKR